MMKVKSLFKISASDRSLAARALLLGVAVVGASALLSGQPALAADKDKNKVKERLEQWKMLRMLLEENLLLKMMNL